LRKVPHCHTMYNWENEISTERYQRVLQRSGDEIL